MMSQKMLNLFLNKAKASAIYYSANTVWWTHLEHDLKRGSAPFPLDVFGSPLLMHDNVREYLNWEAVSGHVAYGKYPVRNFLVFHARNIHLLTRLAEFNPRMGHEECCKLLDASYPDEVITVDDRQYDLINGEPIQVLGGHEADLVVVDDPIELPKNYEQRKVWGRKYF